MLIGITKLFIHIFLKKLNIKFYQILISLKIITNLTIINYHYIIK